jgi:hypothetical protein
MIKTPGSVVLSIMLVLVIVLAGSGAAGVRKEGHRFP